MALLAKCPLLSLFSLSLPSLSPLINGLFEHAVEDEHMKEFKTQYCYASPPTLEVPPL